MRRLVKISDLPARLAAGAFILNSGITKLQATEEMAEQLHGMAVGTYPFLKKIPPARFTRLLAVGEVTIGAALVVPVVPTAVAGAALAAFGTALLGLYLRTPGMRQPRSIRPSPQGIPLAKDVWLVGTGLSLAASGLEHDR